MTVSFLDVLERLGGVLPVGSDTLLPFTAQEISELERLAGSSFPSDYRRFLAEAGGFVFNEEVRFPTIDPLPRDFSSTGLGRAGAFFGSQRMRAHHTATLRWNVEVSPDYYPRRHIAIAHDGSGGKLLLDLRKRTSGTVRYYPQLNDWFKSEEEDPYRAADSFSAFIGSLRKERRNA